MRAAPAPGCRSPSLSACGSVFSRSRSTRCRSRSRRHAAAGSAHRWCCRGCIGCGPEMVVEVSYVEWTPDGLLAACRLSGRARGQAGHRGAPRPTSKLLTAFDCSTPHGCCSRKEHQFLIRRQKQPAGVDPPDRRASRGDRMKAYRIASFGSVDGVVLGSRDDLRPSTREILFACARPRSITAT